MGDDEVCDIGLGVEMMIEHDTRGGVIAYDITKCPHALEFTVITHDDKVGPLHYGTYFVLMVFIDEDIFGPWNPMEEIWEEIGGNDMDISLWIVAAQP